MEEINRDPDLILQHIEISEEKNGKGKLKIFFGYAAGVGKTYAMLSSAHLAKKAGIDVVAGYIEPHPRPETSRLIRGLEVLPHKKMQMGSIKVNELDIDAALERKPELILVDELAHTNAAGSRHKKRYEDIKELLNAGIDVYTTINVQHLESLNDTITGLTGIVVRERIPDSVFDEASQIVMVDIPPEELIHRLEQGKVYREGQAQRALSGFFNLKNLIALREIALRRMADWVNVEHESQMIHTENTGAAFEHILMCLSPSPSNPKVIRQAARLAKAFHGRFTAFYVETSEFSEIDSEDLKRLRENTKLAEQLGAKIIISYGSDIPRQIAEYANVAKVTKIVLGRTYTRRSILAVKESFSQQLARRAPDLEIFIIPDSFKKQYVKVRKKKKVVSISKRYTIDFIQAVVIFMITLLMCVAFYHWGLEDSNIIMLYLLSVLVVSLVTYHRLTSMIYSIISILGFNFFFTEPRKTFLVNDPSYIMTFFVMFVIAFITSSLAQKLKKIAAQAAKKAYRTEILLETSQKLQQAHHANEIAQTLTLQLGKLLDRNIYCYKGYPEEGKAPHVYKTDKLMDEVLPKQELAVAQWTYKNNKHAGFSTTTLPGAHCLYLAVRNDEKVFAVVGIDMQEKVIPTFEESIMSAILNECALSFEKDELIQQEQEVAIRLKQEQLRANLLRSISHDLRTPLTSISGDAGVLMRRGDELDADQKHKMYEDIYDDAMWLINLVENLLSVTRIENGTMKLNMQPELLDDVITEALKHVNRRMIEHQIKVSQEDDMLVVNMDAKLIMQVIINLVDNAIKYTESGSIIEISTRKQADEVVIEVADNGPGLDDVQKEKIFGMFYRVNDSMSDSRRGMGLGLPLCQSIISAHGGTISVRDRKPHGTCFQFLLRLEEEIKNAE